LKEPSAIRVLATPIHLYDLYYSENIDMYKAKVLNVLKASDQHVIVPALETGGHPVG